MMDFKRLLHKQDLFARLFGVKLDKFLILIERIAPIWSQAEEKRLNGKTRKRVIGGGRKYTLKEIEEKVMLIIFYYRHNVTHEVLGFMFGLDKSNVTRLLNKLLPLFEQAADPDLKTYLKQAQKEAEKISNPVAFFKKFPGFKNLIVDATEQRKTRSHDNEKRKKDFSGKKKMFSNKTQIIINENQRILDVSQRYFGSTHDKKVFNIDNSAYKIPRHSSLLGDLGYVGAPKEYPDLNMILPHKKPKGKELTKEQKKFNKQHSRERVSVEHAIGKNKKFRILADTYRGKEESYNQIFRNISALVNLNYCST